MSNPSDHREYTKQHFMEQLPTYDLVVFPLRPLRRKLVKMLHAGKGTRVLDVACGTGEQSIAFARAGCSVVGVDLTEPMLNKARSKVGDGMDITFVNADASSLSYGDEMFDISTVSFGLHDMPRDMAIAVLREMRRVTKRDGTIAIVEHHRSPTVFGALVHRMMQRNETRYYEDFIRTGLGSYLDDVGLVSRKCQLKLLGIVQICVCSNASTNSMS